MNLENGVATSGNVARYGQANKPSCADFSSIVEEPKRQIVGAKVSSDCGENIRPINDMIDVVVNEKRGIAVGIRSQIISDA